MPTQLLRDDASTQTSKCARGRSEIRTQNAECSQHGVVEAVKEVPRVRFPFLIYGPLHIIGNARSFRCPECGAKTTPV
jgi:hypothetical protein